MKPIELTEEHKSKLLEMCKVLFPKYKYYDIWNNDIILGTISRKNDTDESDEFLENLISIHWFEFCHEYLSVKIFGDYNIIFSGPNRPHPVDYLYAEFLKIK